MTLVVDASALVAALTDDGDDGTWTSAVIKDEPLVAPHLLTVEAANILRKLVLRGRLSQDAASACHDDLVDWPIEYFSYRPLADRVWALQDNVTSYDAWYVALAEYLDVGLVTLDRRLSLAPGPRCDFLVPPAR